MSKNILKLFDDLKKMDPTLSQALANIRAGRATPQDADVVSRGLYTDTMIPRIGNKYAYNDHVSRHANDGIHTHLDLNDFRQINKQHGQQHGDAAIKQFGNIAADVSRMFGGKMHRRGGDEFSAWFHRPEAAHGFARELRNRLEKTPKVAGTHNLAASIGIGYTPEHAEKALLEAKKQLGSTDPTTGQRVNVHSVGNAPTVIHSLTHEQPPENWKPSKGQAPGQAKELPSLAPAGLQFNNPLAKSTAKQPVPSKHPALEGGRVGIMTGENPFHPATASGGNAGLENELRSRGLRFEKVKGKYSEGEPENSFIIHDVDAPTLMDLGKRYGQDSVLHSHNGTHKLIYTNGPNEGTYHPGHGLTVHPQEPEMYYSTLVHNGNPVHFTMNLDFDQKLPLSSHSTQKPSNHEQQ